MKTGGAAGLETIQLDINGRLHEVTVPKANWTLLSVLRETLGLTGTKCGCGTGDCGACKVIVDGKAVNACTLLATKAVGKRIITIEGLAGVGGLHPIQQAFIDAGAVQCGFCTPGMIISTKALLDANPDPTEAEIAAALDNNLCRCTGYVKIVAAVRLVAQMLQGKQRPAPESRPRGHRFVGKATPYREAASRVTGKARFTSDLKLPGMLHAKVLFSPHPHARIKRIDASKAEALPGVHAVATPFNTTRKTYSSGLRYTGHTKPLDEQIFSSVVRYVGDRVAAVAADTPEIAAEAVKLIEVEYELLPAVFDVEEALQPGAPELHPGGNKLKGAYIEAGNVERGLAEADVTLEGTYTTPALHHYALEPHVSIASWEDGKLTVWSSTQLMYSCRLILSELFGLPMNKVRVIKPAIGGGFGGKVDVILEPVVTALSMLAGRPVKLEYTRRECMVATRTRHASTIKVRAGAKRDGTLTALDFHMVINTGAYATRGLTVIAAVSHKAFWLYRAPNIRYQGYPVYTNWPVAGAMRGYGSPQLFSALEIHLDQLARKLGMDPLEFRRRNLVRPWDTNVATGKSLGNCKPLECAERGAELIGWDGSPKTARQGDVVTGLGMASGVHGNGTFPAHTDQATATVRMNEDGSVVIHTGAQEIGQGLITAIVQMVAEVLQIEPGAIEVVEADTDVTMYDFGAVASRGMWVSGAAAKQAAEALLEQVLDEGSKLLGVAKGNLTVDQGHVVNRHKPDQKASYRDVAVFAQLKSQRLLQATETFFSVGNPGSYGAHFAEVAVNTVTGEVKVLRYAAVHDVGKPVNPLVVEGQIEGGIQMGLGYALSEQLLMDRSTGRLANAHPKQYRIFKAKDMPAIQVGMLDSEEQPGPYGAKSIGEAATVPSAPAVINAINQALGTSLRQMPATPEAVLSAIRDSSKP